MSVIARVTCREVAGRVGVGVLIPDPIADSMAHHAYTTEVVLETPEGRRTWWYGGGGDLTEEPIGDDPPFCGEAWVPVWTGRAKLSVTMRLNALWDDDEGNEQEQTWWWSGTGVVEGEGSELSLHECDARTGAPFDVPGVTEVEPERGPTLLAREDGQIIDIVNKAGAVLPGLGVYRPFDHALLTESGVVSTASFQPEGDTYLESSFGGPNGALAVVWNHRRGLSGGMQITFVRLPDGAPRHSKLFEGYHTVHAAVWDPRGERLGAAIFGQGGMRVYVIDADGKVLSESPAPGLKRPDELEWGVSLEWVDGELVTTWSGAEGAPRAVEPGWRQYGAGLPTSRQLPDRTRTAWMLCAEFPRDERPKGVSIIAWLDDDESHGRVVVPDHGWAQDGYRFGKLAILADGRIVAIGTRIWLVDPATSSVVSLGEAGDYPRSLPIHDGRLYNRGPGPWWTALPSA